MLRFQERQPLCLPVFQQIERPDEVGIVPCMQYPQQSSPVEKPLCQQCFEQAPGPRFEIGTFRRRCYALFQPQSVNSSYISSGTSNRSSNDANSG